MGKSSGICLVSISMGTQEEKGPICMTNGPKASQNHLLLTGSPEDDLGTIRSSTSWNHLSALGRKLLIPHSLTIIPSWFNFMSMCTYKAYVSLPFFPENLPVEIEKILLTKNIPVSLGQACLGLQSRTTPEPSGRWFWDTKHLFILGSLGTFGHVVLLAAPVILPLPFLPPILPTSSW